MLQDVDAAAGRPQRGVRGLPVVLGADLNTGAHGLARLHPRFACDEMRWGRRAPRLSHFLPLAYCKTPPKKSTPRFSEVYMSLLAVTAAIFLISTRNHMVCSTTQCPVLVAFETKHSQSSPNAEF